MSHGDSKACSAVKELNVYEGLEIRKEECINHVGKRIGNGLRGLIAEKKKQKKITLVEPKKVH